MIDEVMGPETDTITWEDLKSSPLERTENIQNNPDIPGARLVASHIAYTIAEGCDMWYNFGGSGMSFTTPNIVFSTGG